MWVNSTNPNRFSLNFDNKIVMTEYFYPRESHKYARTRIFWLYFPYPQNCLQIIQCEQLNYYFQLENFVSRWEIRSSMDVVRTLF